MRCHRCNKQMVGGEGVKVGRTIAGGNMYYCAECAPNTPIKMGYIIEVNRMNDVPHSDYSNITINGLEVGLGPEESCERLAEELRQDDSKAKVLYDYWIDDAKEK